MLEEVERKRARTALEKLEFQDHIQIQGVLFILKLFQYEKFPTLLGVSKKIYKIKGLERFIDEHRCRHHVDVIVDYLDRRGILDRLHGNAQTKLHFPIRQQFITDIINKMEDFIGDNEAVFNDPIFDEYQIEINHISHILRHKDKKDIPSAVELTHVRDQKVLSTFMTNNFKALKRLCVVDYNSTISILDSRDRFFGVKNELDTDAFEVKKVLNSNFVSNGMDLFISPEFIAGLITSLYGVLAAALIATILSLLVLTPMALAVLSLVCTVVFCIFVPMIMGSAITTFFEWVYGELKEKLEDSMRDFSEDYDNKLTTAGYHNEKVINKEEYVDDDHDFNDEFVNSLSRSASA